MLFWKDHQFVFLMSMQPHGPRTGRSVRTKQPLGPDEIEGTYDAASVWTLGKSTMRDAAPESDKQRDTLFLPPGLSQGVCFIRNFLVHEML